MLQGRGRELVIALILCAGAAASAPGENDRPSEAGPHLEAAATASHQRAVTLRNELEAAGAWRAPFRRAVALQDPWSLISGRSMLLVGDIALKKDKTRSAPSKSPGPRRIENYEPQRPLERGGFLDQGPDFGFEGVPGTGWIPADCAMAVGPGHIVLAVNGQLAFFNKDGTNTLRRAMSGANGFWASLGAGGYVFDPEVHFDPAGNRFWLVACEQTGSAGYLNVAVSNTADPNAGWLKHRLDVSSAGGLDVDSPNMSITGTAAYFSADFDIGGERTMVYIVPRTAFTSASPGGQARHFTIPNRKGMGMPTRLDLSTDPQYMLYAPSLAAGASTIELYAINDPLGAPSATKLDMPVEMFFPPGLPAQMGTTVTPNLYGPRFWHSVYREGSVWAVHHIRKPGAGRTSARWYEIVMNGWPSTGVPPVVRQWGDIDPGFGIEAFCPSIGVDVNGTAAITFARSSASEFISIWRSIRRSSDPLGSFRAPVMVRESLAPFTAMERWGDYSTTVPDPAQAGVFWGHHMFTTSGADWRTWVARYEYRPRADMDGNGILNIADFTAYLNVFNAGDMRADMNFDGILNTADFAAFLTVFATGE